jgi:hypothetical protein
MSKSPVELQTAPKHNTRKLEYLDHMNDKLLSFLDSEETAEKITVEQDSHYLGEFKRMNCAFPNITVEFKNGIILIKIDDTKDPNRVFNEIISKIKRIYTKLDADDERSMPFLGPDELVKVDKFVLGRKYLVKYNGKTFIAICTESETNPDVAKFKILYKQYDTRNNWHKVNETNIEYDPQDDIYYDFFMLPEYAQTISKQNPPEKVLREKNSLHNVKNFLKRTGINKDLADYMASYLGGKQKTKRRSKRNRTRKKRKN